MPKSRHLTLDLALQAAMAHTGRGKFVSIEGSYHGNTLACLSIGASGNREKLPNLLRGCIKVKPPLNAIRVRGLAIGIDFDDGKRASRVGKKCRDEGLLVSPEGGAVLLIPALNIDHDTARKGLDIFERCA